MSIDQQINYLGKDNFIKLSNLEKFNELNSDTKHFLKNYGVFANSVNFPFLESNGKLSIYKEHFICFSKNNLGITFCIDTTNNDRIVSFDEDKKMLHVNSSMQHFIGCLYTFYYYFEHIESAKKHGEYFEKENYKKYAKVLRDMLNKIEPSIENYPIWEEELFQKELGVI